MDVVAQTLHVLESLVGCDFTVVGTTLFPAIVNVNECKTMVSKAEFHKCIGSRPYLIGIDGEPPHVPAIPAHRWRQSQLVVSGKDLQALPSRSSGPRGINTNIVRTGLLNSSRNNPVFGIEEKSLWQFASMNVEGCLSRNWHAENKWLSWSRSYDFSAV